GCAAIGLPRAAREWPSTAILPLAIAGAFVFDRRRSLRYASAVCAMAGLAAMSLGSTAFLDRFGRDPFLADAPSVAVTIVAPNALREFAVPFEVSGLWLSPAARYVALASEDRDERVTIHAGPAGGALEDFAADEAVF